MIITALIYVKLTIDRYDLIRLDQLVPELVMTKPDLFLLLLDLFLDFLVRLKSVVSAYCRDLVLVERILENIIVNNLDRLFNFVPLKSFCLKINNIIKKLLITSRNGSIRSVIRRASLTLKA